MAVVEERQIPDLFTILSLPLPLPQPLSSTRSAGLPNPGSITPSISIVPTISVTSLTQASSAASEVGTVSEPTPVTPSSTGLPFSTSESPPITPTPTPSDPPLSLQATTSADGSTYYVTLYTTSGPSPSPSIQAAPPNSNGFLQNKALSGTVLAVVGVAGLAILIAIASIAIKRSRHQRLHAEAVSFDPASVEEGSTGKRRFSLMSSEHGHSINNSVAAGGNPGLTYAATNPTFAYGGPYQDPYRFASSESQQTLVGNTQPPWSRDNGIPQVPRIDPNLVRGYGGGPDLPRRP